MQVIGTVPIENTHDSERNRSIACAEETIRIVGDLIDTPGWQDAGLTIAGTIRRVGDRFEIEFASKVGLP